VSSILTGAIREALDPASHLAQQAQHKYADKTPEARELLVRHELAQHVQAALQAEPNLIKSETMIRCGGGGASLTLTAPQVLLQWAQEMGASKAVRRFETILRINKGSGAYVAALSEPKISNRIRIDRNVELVPIEQLADSPQKQRLLQRQFNSEFGYSPPATCALIFRKIIDPLLYSDSKELFSSPTFPFEEALSTRLCLSLIGPCAPIQLSAWFQFDDPEIKALSMAGSISYPSPQEAAHFMPIQTRAFDARRAKIILTQFRRLEDHDRQKSTRALERLLQSMCRRLPGDAAIDLSIALESLLGDTGAPGEHIWKISLRAALLSEHNLEKRKAVRQLIKRIYDIRSHVMHDGLISKKHEKDAKERIIDGIAQTAKIIASAIKSGHIPKDWSQFELSGGKM
jgi:hypothetical protein